MCRHFHLALQSGSDDVLARMRRRYTSSGFRDAVQTIRNTVPGASITTDIIAGFPGETGADHQQTLRLMDELRFTDVHVFPYSSRSATSAALLADDVSPHIKRQRAAELRELGAHHHTAALEACVGTVQTVLFESAGSGLSDTYLPVRVETDADLTNQIRGVRVLAADGTGLVGELLG